MSVAASIAFVTGAALAWSDVGSPQARRRSFAALSGLMAVGALANAVSRSPVERGLWTPLTVVTAITSWRSRPQL